VIAIVDYHAGNMASVHKAFRSFSPNCIVTADAATVLRADKVVLPGVGHFSSTATLARNGMADAIGECIARGTPFLGICLGLQWLFKGSQEAQDVCGLGLLPGVCTRLPDGVKSPHVGWNRVRLTGESRLFKPVEDGSYFYFTHSYRAPRSEPTKAICHYGEPFPAAIEDGNVFGVQFHPEKSGAAGLRIVERFCAL
jgi:imidazole glycerol-phosphate synthase subunit HisH